MPGQELCSPFDKDFCGVEEAVNCRHIFENSRVVCTKPCKQGKADNESTKASQHATVSICEAHNRPSKISNLLHTGFGSSRNIFVAISDGLQHRVEFCFTCVFCFCNLCFCGGGVVLLFVFHGVDYSLIKIFLTTILFYIPNNLRNIKQSQNAIQAFIE